ncbi:MAG TPA: two-component regulator propeller domain-containing protein, partial [bacterium]|nr:two-component regulator propeller domain-containing protein [bacterium]
MVTSTPMHPLKKLTLIFCILLMPSSDVSGQIKIHRSVNVEQGLVQSQVTAITRDRWGYVWIGTLGGLSRWDGVRFQNFQTQDGLAGGQISALHEYHDGS